MIQGTQPASRQTRANVNNVGNNLKSPKVRLRNVSQVVSKESNEKKPATDVVPLF
jgi:hypothetical protein